MHEHRQIHTHTHTHTQMHTLFVSHDCESLRERCSRVNKNRRDKSLWACYYRRRCLRVLLMSSLTCGLCLLTLLTCAPSANVCKCPNGTPQSGSGCTKHDASICKECNTGWTIRTDKTKCVKLCQPSSAGATAGSTWTRHGWQSFDGGSTRLYAHAKYAFDLNSDSSWDGCCGGYPNQWIQIDRGSNPAKIFSYELSTDNGECPVDWGVYGSNSASLSSSKLLDSVKGEKCHDKTFRTFDMDIPNSYRYLRWRFTKGVGGDANGIRINDIKLQCDAQGWMGKHILGKGQGRYLSLSLFPPIPFVLPLTSQHTTPHAFIRADRHTDTQTDRQTD